MVDAIKYTPEQKEAIIERLRQGEVVVSFTKVDGDRRDMQCTLNEGKLPPITGPDNAKQTRKENPAIQSVWDVNKQAWRSFRWENVIETTEVTTDASSTQKQNN